MSYLTEYGHHEVFIDTSNIPYGVDWNEVIRKEITNCDIFVILITPSALYRSEVEKEVELAKNLNKKIIPCIAKNYVEEDEIKWGMTKYQGCFYDSDSKLAMDLHRMIKLGVKTQRKTADSSPVSMEERVETNMNTASKSTDTNNEEAIKNNKLSEAIAEETKIKKKSSYDYEKTQLYQPSNQMLIPCRRRIQ